MARVPRVRRTALTQAQSPDVQAGHGWAALATLSATVEAVVRPMALQDAKEQGANAVYRDDNDQLKVDEASLLGGDLAMAHNGAAFAAYLGQSRIDARETLTELRAKHLHDPAGFREASAAYSKMVQDNAPPALRQDIAQSIDAEAVAMFDGLRMGQIKRDNAKADTTSRVARGTLAEDVVSLIQGGASWDDPQVVAKMNEIASISAFRANSAFINESEAETAALLKDIRGTAKAARFMREVDELGGVDNISEADRERLTAAIRDPDLDPGTREKMQRVLDGQLKTIDARSFVQGLTSDDYWDVLRRNEKGGTSDGVPRGPDGKPLSSASGNFGLLNGTFTAMVKKLRAEGKADWAKGLSDEQILKRKGDEVYERQAAERYREQLQGVLTSNGLPINRGNEYVMWVLGDKGGVDALTADPSTPAVDVVGSAAVNANKALMRGKTIGQVIRVLRRKAGGPKASDIGTMRDEVNGISDPETRAMANGHLNEWYRMKRQASAAAADGYSRRIAEGQTITREEVLNDDTLEDAGQALILNAIRKQNEAGQEILETLSDISSGYLDPGSTKDRNRMDQAYKYVTGGVDPLSEQGQAAAGAFIAEGGFAPKSFYTAITGAMNSMDPERIAVAMGIAEQVTRQYPGAFTPYGRGGKALNQDIAEFRHELRTGTTAAEASTTMATRRMPEQVEKRRQRSGEAKKFADSLTNGDLEGVFDNSLPIIGTAPTLAPQMADAMMMMFRREAEEQFIEVGDKEAAKARALAEVSRVFGVSSVAGGFSKVMRLPPESVYPAINGNHEWIGKQLQADVAEAAGAEIPLDSIHLISDDETQADIANGRPASYVYYFTKDGKLERGKDRFFADVDEAQTEFKEALKIEQETFDRKRDATEEFFDDVRRTLPESSMEAARERVKAAKDAADADALDQVRRNAPRPGE